MDITVELGRNIRRYRETANLTQEALAYNAGITSSHLSRIERGIQNISIAVLLKIAKALGVQVYQLFLMEAMPEGGAYLDPRLLLYGKRIEAMSLEQRQKVYLLIDAVTSIAPQGGGPDGYIGQIRKEIRNLQGMLKGLEEETCSLMSGAQIQALLVETEKVIEHLEDTDVQLAARPL